MKLIAVSVNSMDHNQNKHQWEMNIQVFLITECPDFHKNHM